jgi:sugar porter (SP) family MFS transporter
MHTDPSSAAVMGGLMLRDVIPKREKMWWRYKSLLTLNLLLLGCIASDITNGYDGSMLNGLQIIPSWQNFFHHPKATQLGLITNGTRIGQAAALFVINPLISRFGRRKPIAIGSAIMIIGIALQTAAPNLAMFIVGRVFIGFGNNIQQCACPILISELAYPSQRPQITGILNATGSLGQIMAAWITYGTANLSNSWSWRLPSLLQAVTSIFQLIMTFAMPESPRWLVYNNRREEAQRVLAKYHSEGEEGSRLVQFEMAEIDYTLEQEKAQSTGSWMEWFRSRANIHRFCVIVSLGFMIQWCGNALISNYLHLVLNSLGITNTKTQLVINGCYTISGLCFGLFFSLLIDRVGRRKMFLGGMAGMFIAFLLLTIFAGVNAGNNFSSPRLGDVTVTMMFLFGVFYKMASPTQEPYFMEISPYHLRAQTAVLKQFGDAGSNLFSGFVNPIALDAIGWKYYIVWCSMLVSNFTVIYFLFPETKGLSLEEVTQFLNGDYKHVVKVIDELPVDATNEASAEAVEDAGARA